jgi:hypothetical protein
MLSNWHKILCYFAVIIYLFSFTGCGKEGEETTGQPGTTSKHTLTYIAGENGTIVGDNPQIVAQGNDGSLVTAVPAKQYHFAGWSDGVANASRTDLNVTTDLTVTATFVANVQYTLTYTAGKNGSIEGIKWQIVDNGDDGSPVRAVPAAGFHFDKWSDGIEAAARTDYNVTSDLAVTAEFSLNKYTLTYSAGKNGFIEGPSIQTVDHDGEGSPVKAVPDKHYHFSGWSDGVNTPSRTDHKITADITVTANFAIDQYTLTYLAGENGSINGVATQTVNHGGTGTEVTAIPAAGYHFEGWSDGLNKATRTDLEVTADLEVISAFALNQYTLTYSAGENGTIDGASTQIVEHGSDGSLITAVPKKGYHFKTWSDGITTAQRTDTMVTGELAVSALFEINSYTVGGSLSGLVEGTSLTLQNNGGDDLVIRANGEFKFITELHNIDPYEVKVLSQPTSPNQTCTVTNGTGTIPDENVTDISVTCILSTYSIGGHVSGLPDGNQVVLLNNEGDKLVITANGLFTFATPLDDGSQYEVSIDTQPKKPNWTCVLENGAGTLNSIDVTDIIVDCFPEVVLQATPGIREIKLDWNSQDFPDEVTFNLCLAQDDISSTGFGGCKDLKGGALEAKVTSPLIVAKLTNDISYWFQVETSYASGRKTLSEVVMARPFGGLNDTGIDWCADDISNYYTDGTRAEKTRGCKVISATHPDQDALYGRDADARDRILTKIGGGSAGFDFTKVCMSGESAGKGECPPNPSLGSGTNDWACTIDNVTGLVWEVKTTSGLRSQDNSYTWYNPDGSKNGGAAGQQNGGSCKESDCDTQAFVQAINVLGLCGASDWRLPTRKELLSILNNNLFNPAIDTDYFPNTTAEYFWSSSPFSEDETSAWQVYLKYGEANTSKKDQGNRVRLVRGRTVTFGFDNP